MPFAVVVVTSTAVASRRATLTPTQGCGMFDQSAGETCIPFVVFGRVHVDIMSTDATHNGLLSKSLDHHLLCLVTAEMAYDDDTVEIRPSPSAARRAVKRPHQKLFFCRFCFFVFVLRRSQVISFQFESEVARNASPVARVVVTMMPSSMRAVAQCLSLIAALHIKGADAWIRMNGIFTDNMVLQV